MYEKIVQLKIRAEDIIHMEWSGLTPLFLFMRKTNTKNFFTIILKSASATNQNENKEIFYYKEDNTKG